MALVEVVFWVAVGLLVYTHLGYPLLRRARRAAPAALRDAGGVAAELAGGVADRRRPRRGGGDRGEGRQRARARLPARAARADRRLRRLAPTARPSSPARPAPTWCSSCRAAGKVAAQNAARRARARRGARVLRRQRDLGAGRPARARRALRRPAGRLRLRPGAAARPGRVQPGGRLLALRDGGARARVGARRGDRRQRRDLRGARVGLPRRSARPRATTSRSRSCSPSAGWRAVYAPDAVAEEKMVPTIEGEFARKRRMMRGIWDRSSATGCSRRAATADLRSQIARHRVLRYASPFLHLVALGDQPRPARRTGRVYAVTLAASCCCSRRGARRRRPARAAADRPLLRADHRLDRRRLLGPHPPRHARGVGEGGGDAVSRALDLVIAGVALVRRLAGARCSPRSRSSSTRAGRCSTASAASAATAPSSSSASCARWSRAPTRSASATAV